MEYLHKHKGYKPEMLADAPLRELIEATRGTLAEPLRKLSVSQEIPPELTAALDENIFWFSGFKTHHELVEASRLLKDDNGGFKPFERYLQDVRAIDNTYNRNYLNAEYNFATASTQMAVKWKEWEKDGDRYDLQYRTAGDDRVREEHAALDGTTLPPSDPFWNHYLPPNGWNCRCTTVQVRKGKYPRSDSKEAIARGQACTDTPKKQIFRFNPGKQQKIFPPKHPYFPKGCGDCKYKQLAEGKGSQNCEACKVLGKVNDKSTKNKGDIASELSKLHELKGKEYNQQLQSITEMNVFKPHPEVKNVFWTGNTKDPDLQPLLAGAKKLTADKDIKVFILPNPGSGRTNDYIVVRKGIYKDYDLKTITGEHSAGNRLSESIGQTRRVVMNMCTDYNPRTLAGEIKGYFNDNNDAIEVLILKGKRRITVNRKTVESNNYVQMFLKIWRK